MYAKNIGCPECGNSISESARKCKCGWLKTENEKKHDPQCDFVLNGKRCSLPGSISPATHKSDDWRCKYHFENRDSFSLSAKWSKFIEENYHEIIHFREHYQTNFKNCERCKKLCDAESDFMKKREGAPVGNYL